MSLSSEPRSQKSSGFDRAVVAMRESASRMMSRSESKMGEAANLEGAVGRTSAGDLKPATMDQQGGVEAWPLPGLAPMTRVRTTFGDVHAAALRKGDEVLTRDGTYLPILWLTRICLDEHVLKSKPDSNPVVLAPGSLGRNVPAVEIMISPRQIVCADSRIGITRDREAATLISRAGIRRYKETSLSYTMFHVGQYAEVYCEGAFMVFPMDA